MTEAAQPSAAWNFPARLALVNRARLAHVYQWQGDYARGDALFGELLAACAADPDLARYRHSICQHAGKNLFDQGRYAEALALFEELYRSMSLAGFRPSGPEACQ